MKVILIYSPDTKCDRVYLWLPWHIGLFRHMFKTLTSVPQLNFQDTWAAAWFAPHQQKVHLDSVEYHLTEEF